MYYSRVRRRAVASGSKRERKRERERKGEWRIRVNASRANMRLKRASACVVKMLRQLLVQCGHRGIDDNSIPSMWLAEVWWERGEYITSLNRVYYLDPSLQFWHTKKKNINRSRIPHPIFREERHAVRSCFFLIFYKARRRAYRAHWRSRLTRLHNSKIT